MAAWTSRMERSSMFLYASYARSSSPPQTATTLLRPCGAAATCCARQAIARQRSPSDRWSRSGWLIVSRDTSRRPTAWLGWSDSNCGIRWDRNPKWRSRDGSRWSCGVANVQLWQGFRLALSVREAEQHGGAAVQYAWLI